MIRDCTISDGTHFYQLHNGGKDGALTQVQLDSAGFPDWNTAQQVDFLRLFPKTELYLRAITGMLLALEWMQIER